jgi:hypothetical protein
MTQPSLRAFESSHAFCTNLSQTRRTPFIGFTMLSNFALIIEMKLTRKKSGKIIKSALRSSQISSVPATPTKAVHFNEDLEQVRHFLQNDRTVSISADSSPINEQKNTLVRPFPSNRSFSQPVQWEATGFPSSNRDQQLIYFESLYLSADCGRLIGAVTVANTGFEKQVATIFTIDDWQTVSEVPAEYKWTQKPMDTYDRFQFSIALPAQVNLPALALIFCIRYRVNGQEFWDNNAGKNYIVNFTQKMPLLKAGVHCNTSEGHLNNRFSDRYNLATSLRATTALLTASFDTSSTPVSYNQSKLDSIAYKEIIEKLCYFRPEDTADVFGGPSQFRYAALTDRSTDCSQMQSLPNLNLYSNQGSHVFHTIHCY